MLKIAVDIIESESGWGQRLDKTKIFESLQEAEDFVKEYNKDLTGPVPSWYMKAVGPYLKEI